MNAYSYGEPGSKAAALRQHVHELLLEHERTGELPTSNRTLFYELVMREALSKERTPRTDGRVGRRPDQDLSDACKWLRDEGLVPWDWIVDETRSLAAWEYAETVAEYVTQSVGRARIDCWGGADPPLLICEGRGFAGVLRRTLAAEYLCPVTATGGQVGGFLRTNIAPILRGSDRRVLYVGDLDLSGRQIEENTHGVLVQATGERDWRRIALTQEQADEHGLTAIEKVDRRYRPPRVHKAIEVEELPQGVRMALVREALDALLPEPLDLVLVRERAQRERVAALLAEWDA